MNSMSIDEFAEKAEVSRRTVHRWIDSGRVVSEKRGKARVILVDGDVSILHDVTNVTQPENGTNDTNVIEDGTDEKVSTALLELKDREILLLQQQVEFFKTELQRLQVELTLSNAKSKGVLGRIRAYLFPNRSLPKMKEEQLPFLKTASSNVYS